jgi:hypothetical protein
MLCYTVTSSLELHLHAGCYLNILFWLFILSYSCNSAMYLILKVLPCQCFANTWVLLKHCRMFKACWSLGWLGQCFSNFPNNLLPFHDCYSMTHWQPPKLAMVFGIDKKIKQRISMVLMFLGSMLLHASMLRHIWQSYRLPLCPNLWVVLAFLGT